MPTEDKQRADRQRKLNELCRDVLKGFVGRVVTPYLAAQAEAEMRHAINDATRSGTYVLPDGLAVDRVELGADMRFKVFFVQSRPAPPPQLISLVEPPPDLADMASRFEAVAAEIADLDPRFGAAATSRDRDGSS